MKLVVAILSVILLSSCWPKSVSFVDGSMPEDWEIFFVNNLTNNAPNTPVSYAATLSEDIRDGVQNRTRLKIGTSVEDAQVEIDGTINSYSITPIALQDGDNADQNRLTVSVKFDIFINAAEEDQMTLLSTRFIDYDANTDLATVESQFLTEVNEQIIQDLINKLLSNW
ncbi:MAG: hypothetical protein COA33_003215 [Fluviicola sp.]|nr:hypothetical protein [Fluviicola sp.]